MAVDIDFPTFAMINERDLWQHELSDQWDFAPEHQVYYVNDSDSDIREMISVRSNIPVGTALMEYKNRSGGSRFNKGTILWAHREYFNARMADTWSRYPYVCNPHDMKAWMLHYLDIWDVPRFLWRWYMELLIQIYIDGPGPWTDADKDTYVRDERC